jgi:hypothetical protein
MDEGTGCVKEGRENLWTEEGKDRERGMEIDIDREAGSCEGRNGRRKEGRKEPQTSEVARNLWEMSRTEVLCAGKP